MNADKWAIDQMVRRIAKAERHELPQLVTRHEIDENGGAVFRRGVQSTRVGVIENGKWRPRTRIEKAIMRRIEILNKEQRP